MKKPKLPIKIEQTDKSKKIKGTILVVVVRVSKQTKGYIGLIVLLGFGVFIFGFIASIVSEGEWYLASIVSAGI